MSQGSIAIVSIGMPAYNGEKFIARAINSLLTQRFTNFELIISDNASTDHTWEIIKREAAHDSRVKLFRQENNQGAYKNFNFVLSEATGKYFMWAAADDYWSDDFLEKLVSELERDANAGVAMSGIILLDETGEKKGEISYSGPQNPNNMTRQQLISVTTAWGQQMVKYNIFIYGLFRREILVRATAHLSEIMSGDRILIIFLSTVTQFRFVHFPGYYRVIHRKTVYDRYPDENFSKNYQQGGLKLLEGVKVLLRMFQRTPHVSFLHTILQGYTLWRTVRLLSYPIMNVNYGKHILKKIFCKH